MTNYYDRVLEDFESEDLFNESDEAFDDSFDEASDEAYPNGKRRPTNNMRIPSSVNKRATFGRDITANRTGGPGTTYVPKSVLKRELTAIADQVNDLKKSDLSIAGAVKKLDSNNESVVKSIAKKDRAQDSAMSNSTMMTMLSTIVNKPTLNTANLQKAITLSTDVNNNTVVNIDASAANAIDINLTKTLLFSMMPLMMTGSGSSNDNSMMMPLLLIALIPGGLSGGSGQGSDNTLVLVMVMMMMMNKK